MALAASPIVASAGRRASMADVPVYWHLLSFDAPTVAMLWAWSFARAAQVRPAVGEIAVLGIGTWLLYVLDRVLDARPVARHGNLQERHFFHARHRNALLAGCAVACLPMVWLIVRRMGISARRDDTVLLAAALSYFCIVHLPRMRTLRCFRREFAVGILFALGAAVPAWVAAPRGRGEIAVPVALFAALCSLNCLAIEKWESPAAEGQSATVVLLGASLAGGAAALAVECRMLPSRLHAFGELGLAMSILFSALLLLALDRVHRRYSRLALRIAADAALLTPVVLLLPWRG